MMDTMIEDIFENPLSIIAIVLLVINGVTFFLYGMDKWMAQSKSWRISEKTLWFFALIGGSVGTLAGMHFFRHKTKKVSFQFVLALIILMQVGVLFLVLTTIENSTTPAVI